MLICPKCKKEVNITKTKYGMRNNCCEFWSWGINEPLADVATHDARKDAHIEFDKIWKNKFMTRKKAYSFLANELNLNIKECHIKKMDAKTANLVIEISKTYLKGKHI